MRPRGVFGGTGVGGTGLLLVVTVTLSWFEVTADSPKKACPTATFVTEPASRSACVIVYAAVQVTVAPGARLAAAGHVTVALSSVTENGPVSVTFPLFVIP